MRCLSGISLVMAYVHVIVFDASVSSGSLFLVYIHFCPRQAS